MTSPDKNEIIFNHKDPLKNISDLFNAKKYNDCTIECEKLLALSPRNTVAHLYLGMIFESQKEYEKAILHYSHILESFPEFSNLYAVKGINQFELGDYKSSKDSFVEYLSRNDDNAKIWGIVAQLENILSGRRNAMQVLDEAERRTTKNKDLLYRTRGSILRRSDPDSALLYLLQAQNETKDEKQKEKYSGEIYHLILKHIDPLRRLKAVITPNPKE